MRMKNKKLTTQHQYIVFITTTIYDHTIITDVLLTISQLSSQQHSTNYNNERPQATQECHKLTTTTDIILKWIKKWMY